MKDKQKTDNRDDGCTRFGNIQEWPRKRHQEIDERNNSGNRVREVTKKGSHVGLNGKFSDSV